MMSHSTINKRILALDILRGITIAGMIMVNNPGSYLHVYEPLRHAEWNGLTPTDLVFPFFMFIMGISTYISLRKYDFRFSHAVAAKIVKRTLLIFLVGLALNWLSGFSFDHLRILGVMQRLAICYGATAIIALVVKHRYIPWLIVGLLVGYFVLLLCGDGFVYGESNVLSVVDRAILTPAHMYSDRGIEPEGLLSTLPSVAHVLVGFYVGKLMLDGNRSADRASFLNTQLITLFLAGAVLTFAGFLLSYGCPINKKIWSPTYVLVTCGLASTLLALLVWVIDVKGHHKWCRFFETFGVNPLFMYVLGNVLGLLVGGIILRDGGEPISLQAYFYNLCCLPLFGGKLGSLVYALLFIGINWCIGYQLYKRKIYIKL